MTEAYRKYGRALFHCLKGSHGGGKALHITAKGKIHVVWDELS